MDKIVVRGGKKLYGEITINGAKNAAVAIIPAAILARDVVHILNVPKISDIDVIVDILRSLGAEVKYEGNGEIEIDSRNLTYNEIPWEFSKKFRASYYFIGIMLALFNKAEVAMPGGDDFGSRPMDKHYNGFEKLGCTIEQPTVPNGTVKVTAEKLKGNIIDLGTKTSVGATINIMLAAVLAEGETEIRNAAREPHILDLANFLNLMGANIAGAGTSTIRISDKKHDKTDPDKLVDVELKGCLHSIIPDQIQTGTYMAAVAACGGEVYINGVNPKHIEVIADKLEEAGAEVAKTDDDQICVTREGDLIRCNLQTEPYPGFPTDMHPQMAAMLTVAKGTSAIMESVWDNRFQYVTELEKMGAVITTMENVAFIYGQDRLHGAEVQAKDLRADAAMIIAGLIADGETVLSDTCNVDRGYENLVENLTSLGADIKRITVE